MAKQTCPKCGTRFPTGQGWAQSTVSLLIPAPAVPDMATQVRCPHCQYLFAEGEIRHLEASRSGLPLAVFLIACLVLVILAIYQMS